MNSSEDNLKAKVIKIDRRTCWQSVFADDSLTDNNVQFVKTGVIGNGLSLKIIAQLAVKFPLHTQDFIDYHDHETVANCTAAELVALQTIEPEFFVKLLLASSASVVAQAVDSIDVKNFNFPPLQVETILETGLWKIGAKKTHFANTQQVKLYGLQPQKLSVDWDYDGPIPTSVRILEVSYPDTAGAQMSALAFDCFKNRKMDAQDWAKLPEKMRRDIEIEVTGFIYLPENHDYTSPYKESILDRFDHAFVSFYKVRFDEEIFNYNFDIAHSVLHNGHNDELLNYMANLVAK